MVPCAVLTWGNIGKHRNNETSYEDRKLMHSQADGKWPKQAVNEKHKILIKFMVFKLCGLFVS